MTSIHRLIETSKAAKSYLISLLNNGYTFSLTDLYLYLNERFSMTRPVLNLESHQDNGFDQLEIGGKRIFWPEEMASDDLSWLFGEVFTPWNENPSSYDHPRCNVQSASWVIDAGACEGFFSLFAFERGTQRIIAVEPLERLWHALRKTFQAQANQGRFELFEGALGSETGAAYLNLDPRHACDATVASTETGTKVTLVTLDELGERHCLRGGGMIKMDVEGAEMDALLGGTQLLRNQKPKLAVAVYHDYDNAKLCSDIILQANPAYNIEFRGMYNWFYPARPYLLFAW